MGVIPCWTEGLQKMKLGREGAPGVPVEHRLRRPGPPADDPGGATLVFEVELVGITTKAQPAMPGLSLPQAPPSGHSMNPPPGIHILPAKPHPTAPPPATK